MNKFTISVLASLMLGASLSALADDNMKGMDMGKMKMTSSTDAKVAHGVGFIKSIDAKASMITLNHQAIKELNWPAMSMGFKVADPKLLVGLKAGQKVTFELKTEGSKEIVIAITAAK